MKRTLLAIVIGLTAVTSAFAQVIAEWRQIQYHDPFGQSVWVWWNLDEGMCYYADVWGNPLYTDKVYYNHPTWSGTHTEEHGTPEPIPPSVCQTLWENQPYNNRINKQLQNVWAYYIESGTDTVPKFVKIKGEIYSSTNPNFPNGTIVMLDYFWIWHADVDYVRSLPATIMNVNRALHSAIVAGTVGVKDIFHE